MKRRELLKAAVTPTLASLFGGITPGMLAQTLPAPEAASQTTRSLWLNQMNRVALPVLDALARNQLKATMPVEVAPGEERAKHHTTYLEAFGRLISGIAPWLERDVSASPERELHARYRALALQGLATAVDPSSPDYLDFGNTPQTLVDAAFLAVGVLRAPRTLNADLPAKTRKQLVEALRRVSPILPGYSNWQLFAAAVEAALHALHEPWDRMRVDYALRDHMNWYVGDGTYGDGPHFHWDYYNSYVIQPFLLAVLDEVGEEETAWKAMVPAVRERAERYAAVQERMIATDGTFPVVGRSITYRCGAFHHLADAARREMLPADVGPAQVRCALTAVLQRTLQAANTFDQHGWLQIGLAGHQPALGERYISTGSLYLCAEIFLPLGLAPEHSFWSAPDAAWTSQKVWSGRDLSADHAVDG